MDDFTPTSDVKFKSSSKHERTHAKEKRRDGGDRDTRCSQNKRQQRDNHNKRKRKNKHRRSRSHRGEPRNQRLRLEVENVRQQFAMLDRKMAQPQRMHSQSRGKRWDQNAFLNMEDGAPTVPHARVTVAKQRRAPTMQTTRYPRPQPTLMPTQLSCLHQRRYAAH